MSAVANIKSPFDLFLANGVTTIRDFGPNGVPADRALFWRKGIKRGRFKGPTIYATGPILYGPVDNIGKIVRAQKDQGFDFIKLCSFLSVPEFHDAIATAKSLNMHTAGHIPFAADIQAADKTIPLPEVKYFFPQDGATLQSGNPTFSWKAVKAKEPLYYRFEINELNGGRVYSTGHVKGMRSHTVPKGLLKSGQSYRWRIRLTDDDNWEKVQNRSHCAWQNFHIR